MKKAQQAQALRIGEYHPAYGGVYAGTVRGESGKRDYSLFVARGPEGENKSVEFGGYGHDIKDACSALDGAANTAALLAAENTSHPAAAWAAGLSIDGFGDFYLPSRNELRLCYINVPELFDKSDGYWTSTQYAGDQDYAWIQYFDDGGQHYYLKGGSYRARAVRRLVI